MGSNQWLALINRYPDQPVYLPERSLNRANGLSVLWDQLKGSAIQQPTTNYNISYYYLRDMGPVSSDDFVFQTSIRNPVTGPNNPCRSIRVSLVCTQGRISVPLTIAGCSGDIRLVAGDHVIDGRNEDLSAFSADLDQWQPLSVSSKNGALVIALNNQIIYKLPDFKSVGRITGFHYSFEGDGAIRELQLSETSGRTVFSDCFDLY